MSENSKNENVVSIAKDAANVRLPCRGCTVDCKNYKHCNALLWRMSSHSGMDEQKR
jgi:hypothetical protein